MSDMQTEQDFAVPEQNEDLNKDHFALAAKNKGSSGQLLGNVVLVGFLVHERNSAWKKEDVDAMKLVLQKSAEILKTQSGLSNHRLKVSYAFDTVPVQFRYDREEYSRVVNAVLKQYGYETAAAYQAHYKKKFKKDEVALIFFINRDFRSFAWNTESEQSKGEFSFVSFNESKDACIRTLIHEVLHQFGAIDYYIPARVKAAAQKIFPESIMLHGMEIDDLTRYIIGWDEEPSAAAAHFLEEIKDVTPEEIAKAREKDKDNDW